MAPAGWPDRNSDVSGSGPFRTDRVRGMAIGAADGVHQVLAAFYRSGVRTRCVPLGGSRRNPDLPAGRYRKDACKSQCRSNAHPNSCNDHLHSPLRRAPTRFSAHAHVAAASRNLARQRLRWRSDRRAQMHDHGWLQQHGRARLRAFPCPLVSPWTTDHGPADHWPLNTDHYRTQDHCPGGGSAMTGSGTLFLIAGIDCR